MDCRDPGAKEGRFMISTTLEKLNVSAWIPARAALRAAWPG